MFDLAWSEIALIGVVALIAIGPKDMPVAIKTVAQMVKKARRMAGEFQTHVDEMVREANLHEVRDQINDIRRMDIKGKIMSAVDGDGSIRRTMNDRPFNATPSPTITPPPVPTVVNELPADANADAAASSHADHAIAAPEPAPAFIPPSEAVASVEAPPPMIPPAYTDPRSAPSAQHEAAAHPASQA